MPASRCALVTTGGTIISKIDPATGLAMPVLTGDELLASLAGIVGETEVEVHDVVRVASPHIMPQHWCALHDVIQTLVDREDVYGVVITHGTSTLEETAWFLDLTINTQKPIVVTGAQRNASSRDFDGPSNLLNAIKICQDSKSEGKGVLVALNDQINAAREATKTHTVNVQTFQSGEWGYLGNIVNDRVTFHRAPLRRLHVPLRTHQLPVVEIVSMFVGATGRLIDAALEMGIQGLVVQGVASGHVNAAMYEAVLRTLERGVPVVIATRIPQGGTRAGYGFPGSSQLLLDAGAVLCNDLSAWKARILLMLALQDEASMSAGLQELFDA
ncbi:asparaginase [Allopusillimonas soli]|uniref:Asparaginase n=1 Tax=Allopusillimonas soli TaxID=659016 RepID=A0A853F7T0_9BURK|nr:asparaginase [Allopusillimonas soli]NYT35878.1 asparaginase [Allopusillimonas soli]TEA76242.1 asparaginase [Allopusillimonas soli]